MPVSQTASPDRPPLLILARYAEYALVFVCLVVFTEGLLPRLFASESDPESTFLRLLWLPVYALIGIGCAATLPRFLKTVVRLPFLVFILTLACLSWTWSINPEVTERRAIAIFATTLGGLFLAVRYDWRTLLRLLGAVWLFMAVISFASGLLTPGFGVMSEVHPGAWRGMWWEKNALGGHMARAAFLLALLMIVDRPWRLVWGGGLVMSVALVLLSTSKTALLGMMAGFAVLVVAAWMRRGIATTLSTIWLGVISLGAIGLVILIEPQLVFQLLGRDATLTGRTDIWTALLDAIAARPWLGYGYGAFWGLHSEPAYMVRLATEWLVPTAHNGWLETALSIGLIGLGGFMLSFLLLLVRSAWLAVHDWYGVFALGLCGQFLLFSLSESIALQQNTIVWVTYVAVAGKVANSVRNKMQSVRKAPPIKPSAPGRGSAARPGRPGLIRTA
ncbi:O-antigen ligase [Henriciella sp.]|uniref:O-antigen ligase family protein n=1 Tax=Henriciella sp. TaxID=1968823 RepID=UPI002625CF1D|nr:O-antigen ligase [Henriciella sp.]